ncbi:MAG: ferrous iron transporter B [Candidatus Altiarchaeota archaeon]
MKSRQQGSNPDSSERFRKKILLMGNPNVGKSALFSRLTGLNVICSNYGGTTVSFCIGTVKIRDNTFDLIDVPGTYSLEATSDAEKVATDLVAEGDIILNVVDATNLERNLKLTHELMHTGKPMIVALNMWDDTRHLGIHIDKDLLSKRLGVPVVSTVAVSGEGLKTLVESIDKATPSKNKSEGDSDHRYREIGKIIEEVQVLEHRHHTFREHLEDASVKPLTGIPIALFVLYVMFQTIITAGNLIIEYLMDPFFYGVYAPLVVPVAEAIVGTEGLLHEILIGSGENFIESFGVLTTGLYVPFDMVLPFVVLFYFMLALLEDVGYLPRLATLSDSVMHRVGLHGTAIIPSILGLGCNVPGALSVRVLETRKQRFIASLLLAICIPCLAQSAMIFGLLAPHGLKYLAIVYGTLLFLYLFLGGVLNRFLEGESPSILMEIPPYRWPNLKILLKKVWMRVKWFLLEAVPYVLLGVLIVNLMHVTGVVDFLAKLAAPLFVKVFGLPEEAVAALVVGFFRKDVAVGMLAPLGMTAKQLTIASTILAVYFPCVATFTVMIRELGWRDMTLAAAIMAVVSLTVGASLNLLLA